MELRIGKRRLVISNTTKTVGVIFILLAGLFSYTYVFQKTTILEIDRYTGDTRLRVTVRGETIGTQITHSGLAQQMATLGITPPPRQWQFMSRWNMTTRACGSPPDYLAIRYMAWVFEGECNTADPALKKTFLEAFLLHAQTSDEIDLDIQDAQRRVYLLANGQRVAELPMDPA